MKKTTSEKILLSPTLFAYTFVIKAVIITAQTEHTLAELQY